MSRYKKRPIALTRGLCVFTTLKATNQLRITDIISAHEYSLRTTRIRSRNGLPYCIRGQPACDVKLLYQTNRPRRLRQEMRSIFTTQLDSESQPPHSLLTSVYMCGVRKEGAVAQLGERLVRNQKVRGSIPLGSTKGF